MTGRKSRLALFTNRKQKYQNGNIHRKLKVPTSEREGKLSNPRGGAARARCMNFFFRKFTKSRARALRGNHALILPWPKVQ
jgi:hypothetical protein